MSDINVTLTSAEVKATLTSTVIRVTITNGYEYILPDDVVKDSKYVHTDNNYTTTEKNKLNGIAENAEVNVNADWNATDGDGQILNKPSTFPPDAHTHDDRYYTESESNTLLSSKVDKVEGKGLSTNDYTTTEKNKLKGIADGAGVGDMLKTTYDTNNDGIVDKASVLVNATENNAKVETLDTGVKVSRNIADTKPALSVDNVLGTGNIQEFKQGGNLVGFIDKNGTIGGGTEQTVTNKNKYYPLLKDILGNEIAKSFTAYWNGSAYVTDSSIGFGHRSLYNNTGAQSNGFGYLALQNNTGSNSNGFGYTALQNNTGSNNTALGYNSFSAFIPNPAGAKSCDYTAIDTTLKRATVTAHSFGANGTYTLVDYSTTGTAIGEMPVGTVQIKIIDANTIEFTNGSTLRNITSQGTGTHTFTPSMNYSNTTSLGANTQPNRSNQVVLGSTAVNSFRFGGTFRTPASSSDTGVVGEFCYDSNYLYLCTAVNTWKRVALGGETW